MKQELQNKLFEKYSQIFAQTNLGPKETMMCFGISCGDGWYWLLDNLCNCLQSHIDRNNHLQIKATQIKEKFGGLCFYTQGQDDYLTGHIRFAEHLSMSICESCGTTENVTQTEGWIKTICQNCLSKE
jgi:hypothetical protein